MIVFPSPDTGCFKHQTQPIFELDATFFDEHDAQTLQHVMLAEHTDHAPFGIHHHQMAPAGFIHLPRRFSNRAISADRAQRVAHQLAHRQSRGIKPLGQQTRYVALSQYAFGLTIPTDNQVIEQARRHGLQRHRQRFFRSDQFDPLIHHDTQALNRLISINPKMATEICFAGYALQIARLINPDQMTNPLIGHHQLGGGKIEIETRREQRLAHHRPYQQAVEQAVTEQAEQITLGNDPHRLALFDNDKGRQAIVSKLLNRGFKRRIRCHGQHVSAGNIAEAEFGS